jgi:hypothetical protein
VYEVKKLEKEAAVAGENARKMEDKMKTGTL